MGYRKKAETTETTET